MSQTMFDRMMTKIDPDAFAPDAAECIVEPTLSHRREKARRLANALLDELMEPDAAMVGAMAAKMPALGALSSGVTTEVFQVGITAAKTTG